MFYGIPGCENSLIRVSFFEFFSFTWFVLFNFFINVIGCMVTSFKVPMEIIKQNYNVMQEKK